MAEIGFIFGNPSDPLRGPDAPHDLSDQMRAAWISFARHGRPDTDRLPDWPAYLPHRSVLRLTGTDSAVIQGPSGRERTLWEGIR